MNQTEIGQRSFFPAPIRRMLLALAAAALMSGGEARAETAAVEPSPAEPETTAPVEPVPTAPSSPEVSAEASQEPPAPAEPEEAAEPEAGTPESETQEAPEATAELAPPPAAAVSPRPTSAGAGPEVAPTARTRPFWIRAVGELGFLSVLDHHVQFSHDGTYLDYVKQGGQDTLFLNGRISLELGLYRHHEIIFLYQPLAIQTQDVLAESIRVDGLDYPAGTPMTFTYNFPFYRLSYLYDFFSRRDLEVAIGLTLQLRNTTIGFASQDGELYRTNRNVGLVPALKLRVTYHFPFNFWIGTEIDGIYAPISYLNGSSQEITGAILDASLRAGVVLPRNVQLFLNVRYIGGGATGTNANDSGPGDGYVRNWLHFLTVSLGVNWDII
jgi:hypothetical protein